MDRQAGTKSERRTTETCQIFLAMNSEIKKWATSSIPQPQLLLLPRPCRADLALEWIRYDYNRSLRALGNGLSLLDAATANPLALKSLRKRKFSYSTNACDSEQ